jgi:two-component sensor histidine kinase
MYVDMDNRMKGLDGAINGLRQALSEGGTGKPSGPPKPGSSGTTVVDDLVKQYGGAK